MEAFAGHVDDKLPASDVSFTLEFYRELVIKDYSKIVFFLKNSALG